MCLFPEQVHLKDGKQVPLAYWPGKLADYYVPAIATNDIVVFKSLRADWSPFYDFRYRKNTEYLTMMDGEADSANRVGPGFHSCTTWQRASGTMFSDRVVLCIIPKGAHLFKGQHGDLVSDRLITGDLMSVNIYDWEQQAKKLLASRKGKRRGK